jgi:plastocyanin
MRNRHSWLLGLALGVLACGGGNGGTEPSEDGAEGDVIVSNNSFTPSTLSVGVGATVTWGWNSAGTVHNVTFDDGVGNSNNQGSGTHTRTFAQAGSFPYHCTIHGPSMAGVVTVSPTPGGGSGDGGGGGGGGGYGGGG